MPPSRDLIIRIKNKNTLFAKKKGQIRWGKNVWGPTINFEIFNEILCIILHKKYLNLEDPLMLRKKCNMYTEQRILGSKLIYYKT